MKNPSALKSFFPLIIIFILVWCDIGMTYLASNRKIQTEDGIVAFKEESLSVGPMINRFGLIPGLIIGGIINSILFTGIASYFKKEYVYGGLAGVFILAITINLRIFLMTGL